MSEVCKQDYRELVSCISDDFAVLDSYLTDIIERNNTSLSDEIMKYLFSSSKKIRSALIFMFARGILGNVNERQYSIAATIELVHNATLIHDDVIDNSAERRGQTTISAKFNNSLAVIAGDFLFSMAFQSIAEIGSIEIIKIYSEALKQICTGEIEQYFSKYEVMSLDAYIEKSKNKTARLFYIGLYSAFLDDTEQEVLEKIKNFALNFGIAFQIKDDLMNILNTNKRDESLDDFKNGIYTAPLIFACQENKNILDELNSENLYEKLVETGAIAKTKQLIDEYISNAVANLDIIKDNIYKQSLISICEMIKDVEYE